MWLVPYYCSIHKWEVFVHTVMILQLRGPGSSCSITIDKDWGEKSNECLLFFFIPFSEVVLHIKHWSNIFLRLPLLLTHWKMAYKKLFQNGVEEWGDHCLFSLVFKTSFYSKKSMFARLLLTDRGRLIKVKITIQVEHCHRLVACCY